MAPTLADGLTAALPDRARSPAGRAVPRTAYREPWADNLRVTVVAGVVAAHVATTYAVDVDWYYAERTASPVTEAVLSGLVGVGVLFGMGLLFLVAGLMTPPAFARRGARGFVRARLLRLGLPLAGFVLVVDPLTDFASYRATGGTDGLATYLPRWARDDADLSTMWFVAALLAFSLGYAAWRARRPATGDGPLGARALAAFGAVIVAGSYAVRLRWPFLSDALYGLNVWELPQMVAMFALGAVAAERGWLAGPLPPRFARRCGVAALAAAAAAVAVAMTPDAEAYLGGPHPRALLLPAVEAVVAIGASLWVLEWYRRRWNAAGALARRLGRASYAAYVLHPPVVVAASLALRPVAVPAEAKLAVVLAAGLAGSFALGALVTSWRPWRRGRRV